ncbi:MAG: asparagine--tRNA ligase [Spirochaetes bacterium]|nr:MAG: asparagine--tRNA ligase [Spirochaetota bacterium]
MKNLRIKEILQLTPQCQEVEARGWVRTKRDTKNVCFFELNDGSCLENLQVVIDKNRVNLEKEIHRMNTGASVIVRGKLAPSPGKEQSSELSAENLTVVGEAEPDYPLQKKRHTFEFLREIAHLRPRTNTFGAIARVRNTAGMAIHSFFQERGFIYLHSPIITASDCEGAGEMFQITTLPLENPPTVDGKIDFTQDFFGKRTSLTVSGQLEAEIYASALGNVYTFGPTFRAENSNTSRHLAEFWMIEPEMAFCDINCNMDIAESFLKHILKEILEKAREDMEFFDKRIKPGLIDGLQAVASSTFARITYTEAIEHLNRAEENFEFPTEWGCDLQSEHEKYLTEKVFNGPVIVTDYPKEIKAFYMKLNDDEKTVRAMDVLVPRIGEIIGGSERESDFNTLKRRIAECGLRVEDYWWYLDLRRYGSVPHSGFGLGFERFIQWVTGMQNIRDVIPFPRTVKLAEF